MSLTKWHDLTTGFPSGEFDNVNWDAAVAYFSLDQSRAILGAISKVVGQDGVFTGSTIKSEHQPGDHYVASHKQELHSSAELRNFLAPFFGHIVIWETFHPSRSNLYFACSQRPVLVIQPTWKGYR